MKKNILTVLLTMVLTISCGLLLANHLVEPKADTYTNSNTLEWIFNNVDYNYTRVTTMYFNDSAYSKASEANHYKNFQKSRTTYWIKNGLYMTNSDGVDSGYLTKADEPDKMYHFTIEDGNSKLDDPNKVKNVAFAADIVGGVDAFFVNMHKFHENATAYAGKFTNTADNVWTSTDSEMITYFLAFCASCYTNTEAWDTNGDGVAEVLEFEKVTVTLQQSGTYYFDLYVKSEFYCILDDAHLDTGLFARADVHNVTSTSIPAIASYLPS